MRYEFLPPYSPDYNPIELAFSAMKYYLRCHGEYNRLALTELPYANVICILLEALDSVTLADIYGWYRHCGYL